MANKKLKTPALVHHKPTGRARVRIEGRDYYLGRWGDPEVEARYRRLVAEYIATGLPPGSRPAAGPAAGVSVNELLLAFMRHAQQHYRKPDGTPTDELHCYKSALKPVRRLYGMMPVADFDTVSLLAVREEMILAGWSRGYINRSINRVRHVFRWGVVPKLVPAAVVVELECVPALQAGRCAAPDHPERRPVPQDQIEAVRAVVRKRTRDLMDLQLLTGARSGELLQLTTGMFDRSGEVWQARLSDHKTAHHGKERVLMFGPKAQTILADYLRDDFPDRKLFKVRRDSFGAAVRNGCIKAGVPVFTPHWLRHTAATRIRDEHGVEAAQVMLGHSKIDMTQHYSAQARSKAAAVAREVG